MYKIGEIYTHTTREVLAYYCGKNSNNNPVFELISSTEGIKEVLMDGEVHSWVSKGTGKYWCYRGLETEFKNLIINPIEILEIF